MSDEPTLGEVARRLTDVQNTVHSLAEKLDRDYVRAAQLAAVERAAEDRDKEQDRRISGLESSVTWVVRLVLSAVILALLGLVIVQGGKP